MMWRSSFKAFVGMALTSLALVGCGGGGGGGAPLYGNGPGSGTGTGPGGTPPAGATYAIGLTLERAGTDTTSMSSTETLKAVAKLTANGQPVANQIITFSESGGTLLKFAPATALTDASGIAKADVSAALTTAMGATTVNAAAKIGTAEATGLHTVSVQAMPVTGEKLVPASMSFDDVTPSNGVIVIQNSGGAGKPTSATLRFTIRDKNGTPIPDSPVNFSIDSADAVLNIPSARSNGNGQVMTTVLSGNKPSSIVVLAVSAEVPSVRNISGLLRVSNGPASAESFTLAASKYNLNWFNRDDTSSISVRVADQSGGPVNEKMAVYFVTDGGVVFDPAGTGSASCTTDDTGKCAVTFRVQNPAGDKGLATVKAELRKGPDIPSIVGQIQLNMSGASGAWYARQNRIDAGPPVKDWRYEKASALDMGGKCIASFNMLMGDGAHRPVPAGTTITAAGNSTAMKVNIPTGSPALDAPEMNPFTLGIDLTAAGLPTPCVEGAGSTATVDVTLNMSIAPTSVAQKITVTYPK